MAQPWAQSNVSEYRNNSLTSVFRQWREKKRKKLISQSSTGAHKNHMEMYKKNQQLDYDFSVSLLFFVGACSSLVIPNP